MQLLQLQRQLTLTKVKRRYLQTHYLRSLRINNFEMFKAFAKGLSKPWEANQSHFSIDFMALLFFLISLKRVASPSKCRGQI